MAKKENVLAHTKWVCKYHIVFTLKYRRKIIYNQYKENCYEIFASGAETEEFSYRLVIKDGLRLKSTVKSVLETMS